MMSDDMDLVRQYVRHNSEEAFATLVSRHVNLVYSVALRRLGDAHLAEEVTQAAFIILAHKAGSLGLKTIVSAWLCRTTQYAAARALRTQRRRQNREQEAYMQSLLNQPEASAWTHIAPLLDDAMAQLGEQDHSAIVLRFFEGKALKQVGAALGVSENTAKTRVSRAVEKLRRCFMKRGIVLSAAVIGGAISASSVQAAPALLAKSVTAIAVTKGAAASGSTLTLIKGALKLMAWTKVKVAVITSAIVLLAGVTTVTVTHHIQHTRPTQTGRLKLPTGNVTPMVRYGYSRNGIILASDGSLWSWGEERLGWPVLGLKDTQIQNTVSLRRIGNKNNWVNVAVADSHCLAIKSDGTLWAWGGNLYYQLGDGTKITRSTPVPSISGNDWKEVAAGGGSGLAIKNDGTLWAWGANASGQLGIGSYQSTSHAVQVGSATQWIKIWAGANQTVGLQSDGSLWFWGSATGDSQGRKVNVPTRISPDTNWVDVCFGYFTVLALKADGTLWSWGNEANFYTQSTDLSLNGTPMQVGTETDWQACASSPGCLYHLLRKKDSSLWALDASEHRQIKPASEYHPIKLRKINLPKDVAAFTAGGDDIGVVLTPDGEVWTWGRVIGDHSPKDYESPNGDRLSPKFKVMDKPWQLSNLE